MSKHTPGPWFARTITIETTLGPLPSCEIVNEGGAVMNSMADYLLMAAAPEMLKALNSIFLKCSFEHVRDWQQFRREVGELAGVAIAKLEGIE